MKNKILFLIGIVVCLSSCRKVEPENPQEGFTTIEREGCQYLIKTARRGYGGYGYMTHKGNCKNPIHNEKITVPTTQDFK
jgi:hypothetical protein